jgi:hypothetical protein
MGHTVPSARGRYTRTYAVRVSRRPPDPNVTTVYLGQFTRQHANQIGEELERRDIVWWYKDPGYFSRIWEFGIRLFVDRARLAEARKIAERVTGPDE